MATLFADTFLSLGLMVPLSVLSLRLLADSVVFSLHCQAAMRRVAGLQSVMLEAMKTDERRSFTFRNGSLCIPLRGSGASVVVWGAVCPSRRGQGVMASRSVGVGTPVVHVLSPGVLSRVP